ncbi:MAG: SDR family NAD(P)-dependent oxidoreductase [Paracoccaceae bacterium]|nr:SDR family NAD(P)-dependent oxidoreductase [Paracoccaceae bacterium]MDG1738169.1 SDR family NAD(P)-dependent oxidoreductase [Paracoccaceae bacterium]MDG2258979.1 SDR family NAD(P)-dependent oxidoreductase [Paracoccaceae bacterium]
MNEFADQIVVVTGGAGGIGACCVADFAAQGARVFALDSNADSLKDMMADMPENVSAITVDVTDRAALERAFNTIATSGGTDILVATAAIVKRESILDFDVQDWGRIIDVNLTGTFHCCQLAGRQMRTKGKGRIVTVSSVNGQIANTGRGAYSCTKGGVDMLTKMLAAELGNQGITANAVSPTPVDTPMIKKVHGPKDREVWHQQIPAERYARPEEVTEAIKFLASDKAAYINGHILNVDGGFMASGVLFR